MRRQSVRETMQAHAFFNDIPGAEPGEDANARLAWGWGEISFVVGVMLFFGIILQVWTY